MALRRGTLAWLWGWIKPIVSGLLFGALIGAVILGISSLFPKASSNPYPLAVSDTDPRQDVMDDPFVQLTRAAAAGGEVRVYYIPSDGRLLMVFDDLAAPPEGAGLVVTVECAKGPIELGMLAARFYGDTSSSSDRNSLLYDGAESCSTVVLTATTVEGDEGSTVRIPIAPPHASPLAPEDA